MKSGARKARSINSLYFMWHSCRPSKPKFPRRSSSQLMGIYLFGFFFFVHFVWGFLMIVAIANIFCEVFLFWQISFFPSNLISAKYPNPALDLAFRVTSPSPVSHLGTEEIWTYDPVAFKPWRWKEKSAGDSTNVFLAGDFCLTKEPVPSPADKKHFCSVSFTF